MSKYIKPEFNFTQFSIEDVITESGEIVSAERLVGENKEMYEIYSQNSSVKNDNISVFTW